MPTTEEQINNACQVGQILHLFWIVANKPKFFVIACIEPLLLFVINSGINQFKRTHPDHLACQVKINCSEHTCFNSDSYIDCTQIITDFDIERIKTILSVNLSDIKSVLSNVTKQEIIKAISASRLLSNINKNYIINSLR